MRDSKQSLRGSCIGSFMGFKEAVADSMKDVKVRGIGS